MNVCELMTPGVITVTPDHSIRFAAGLMSANDIGFLPVEKNDRLVGMVTDRDVAIRVVAEGRDSETLVRDVMTKDVNYCFDDEDIMHVARYMGDIKVRRLPVLNRKKLLVGVVALADIAPVSKDAAATVIAGVSSPGWPHTQIKP